MVVVGGEGVLYGAGLYFLVTCKAGSSDSCSISIAFSPSCASIITRVVFAVKRNNKDLVRALVCARHTTQIEKFNPSFSNIFLRN